LDVDRTVRTLAESACRRVWTRDGDKQQRRQLMSVTRSNAAGRYQEAIEEASRLVSEVPHFAEVWYQRGAAWFQLKDYARAIDDWTQALELNAYHFVAATAMGAAYLRLNDPLSALKSLRRALLLNPDLENVREQVDELGREIEGE
jgi:tetratricopeptide (TPR) repeat protein